MENTENVENGPRVVYLEDPESESPPRPFRAGAAGRVLLAPDGALETDTRVRLSANTTHALLGHGVVDALNALPLEGRVGDGEITLVPPAVLEPVCALFYEADRKTYGARYEFVVATERDVEYRVRIDNREYQRGLARLTFLTTTAGREGHAVWLRI